MLLRQSDTVRIAALFKGWTLLILPPGLFRVLLAVPSALLLLMAEDTRFELIPTESGHRDRIRTRNPTVSIQQGFPLAYSMKVCCAAFTPILNIILL